jgi:hypothetical protein
MISSQVFVVFFTHLFRILFTPGRRTFALASLRYNIKLKMSSPQTCSCLWKYESYVLSQDYFTSCLMRHIICDINFKCHSLQVSNCCSSTLHLVFMSLCNMSPSWKTWSPTFLWYQEYHSSSTSTDKYATISSFYLPPLCSPYQYNRWAEISLYSAHE